MARKRKKSKITIREVLKKLIPQKKSVDYKVKYVTDNPDYETIKKGQLIVVGGKEYVKWAYFKCPDGCGDVIVLPLIENEDSYWKLKVDKTGHPTLSPSVSKTDGCKSHFYIRKGKVVWARFYGED